MIEPITLRAGYAAQELTLTAEAAIDIVAAADGSGPPTATIHAYTGGLMRVKGMPTPVVVELSGVQAEGDTIPLLRDHSMAAVVGHGRLRVEAGGVFVDGVLSGSGPARTEVVEAARNGFPWQASIGARVVRAQLIPAKQTVTVNGRTFSGPVLVARESVVYETSFVALGADTATRARIAAQHPTKGPRMTFEEFLAGLGIEASAITPDQRTAFEAAYRASQDAKATPADADELVADIRAKHAAELDRIAKIRDLCGDEHADISAKAVAAGWDPVRAELEILRSGRTTVPSAIRRGSAGDPVNPRCIEAAVMLTLGYDDETTRKQFGDQVLDQVDKSRLRGLGLRDLCAAAARLEGIDIPAVFGDGKAVIEASTSTRTLSSVVSNVVSKIAHRVYDEYPVAAFEIARVRNVPDFKAVKSFRLDGSGQWAQVAKDGKLDHGKLEDTEYSNQAETYGQVIGITRKDIVNDDLGILNDIGRLMGQSGASLIDHLAFTLLLANTGSFFHANNANLSSGAGSALAVAGLSAARALFRKQKAGPGAKAADKRPIMVTPRVLLVPPELETTAETLLNSTQLNLTGTSSAEKPDRNPWFNKFKLVTAPHISDSAYSGYSATAYYLFADPNVVPAMELAFVNGVRTPTIERVAPPSDTLGIFYRGYLDVGVAFVDPKGAVKSAGA